MVELQANPRECLCVENFMTELIFTVAAIFGIIICHQICGVQYLTLKVCCLSGVWSCPPTKERVNLRQNHDISFDKGSRFLLPGNLIRIRLESVCIFLVI